MLSLIFCKPSLSIPIQQSFLAFHFRVFESSNSNSFNMFTLHCQFRDTDCYHNLRLTSQNGLDQFSVMHQLVPKVSSSIYPMLLIPFALHCSLRNSFKRNYITTCREPKYLRKLCYLRQSRQAAFQFRIVL